MITPISKAQVVDFLRSVSIMTLAASHENTPLATVLLFAVDDDLTFYFATRSHSHKAEAIRNNPKVSLAIWAHQKMLVQADGDASQVLDQSEADSALDKIVNATNNIQDFWPPVLRFDTKDDYAIFKIKPHWVRALSLESKTIRSGESPFTEIAL